MFYGDESYNDHWCLLTEDNDFSSLFSVCFACVNNWPCDFLLFEKASLYVVFSGGVVDCTNTMHGLQYFLVEILDFPHVRMR